MTARRASEARRAVIVADLGFGDAGKGLITDFLVRALGAHTVVRYNGGAQAGHNVTTIDGRHHTFAHLGAGSFVPGVRTWLSRHMVVHPTALLVEARRLEERGVPDPLARLSISDEALVITPIHQAANRLRELARGEARHGSCGVGVGEAARDAIALGPEALRMKALRDPVALRASLLQAQARKREELDGEIKALQRDPRAARELSALLDAGVVDAWIARVATLTEAGTLAADEALGARLAQGGAVIFEGAQGVLLDEWLGFHPHTTWSTCTFARAQALLREHGYAGAVSRLGDLRTYAVRHGEGPLPPEAPSLASVLPEAHNTDGPWQGPFRVGYPDLVLGRYGVEACGGADALALTHLDAVSRLKPLRACHAYRLGAPIDPGLFEVTAEGLIQRIRVEHGRCLERQAAIGQALRQVEPRYEDLGEGGEARLIARFEEAIGLPLRLAARGKTARDVTWVGEPW